MAERVTIVHWHTLVRQPYVTERDSGYNLLDLPAGFHWNHPQYSDWVYRQLNGIKNKYDSLPHKEVEKFIEEAKVEIGKAYEIWQKNGCDKAYNMNEYFRLLNLKSK